MTGHAESLLKPAAAESRATRVQKVRSPGGIEAWLVEDYAIPLIAANFGFKGGAAQDPLHKPGVATLLAGLLDEGAGPLDSAAFHQALDDEAIDLSFSADRDALHGRMKTLSRNAARAFELAGLAVQEARLEPESVERVRGQIAASLRRELNDPDQAAARVFRAHSYPDHPYGQPVKGDLAILPTITRDDIVALRTRTMARDNLKVAVVGAIDAETLGRELDRVFGALPASADLVPVPTVAISGVGTRHVTAIDIPQSTIRFGRQGLMRNDPDYDVGTVVNHCLAPAPSPRGSIRKCARSVGYAIRSTHRIPSWTTLRCWSARPRPRTSGRSRRSRSSAPRSTSWRATASARTSLRRRRNISSARTRCGSTRRARSPATSSISSSTATTSTASIRATPRSRRLPSRTRRASPSACSVTAIS